MIVIMAIAVASCGLLARVAVRRGPWKGPGFARGSLAVRVRRNFETC
jgi:hypothetical protein